MDIFVQQLVNGLTLGAVYAIVALGYTMVYGIIQLINFAHGEVVMIGAMVAFTVINLLAKAGMPPVLVVLIGAACAIPASIAEGAASAKAHGEAATSSVIARRKDALKPNPRSGGTVIKSTAPRSTAGTKRPVKASTVRCAPAFCA